MGANRISRDRLRLATPIVPEKAVLKHRIWTERLRIGRVAIFQVNAPKVFKAAVLIVVAAEADLAVVIALVVAAAVDSAAVIASVAAEASADSAVAIASVVAVASAAVALEGSAAAGSGAAGGSN